MTNDAFRVLNRSLYSSFKHILLAKFRLTTVIAYDYLVWVFFFAELFAVFVFKN